MANRRPYRVVDIGPTEPRPATPQPQFHTQPVTETPECIDTGFWAHFLSKTRSCTPEKNEQTFTICSVLWQMPLEIFLTPDCCMTEDN